jgi:hypothetical protein
MRHDTYRAMLAGRRFLSADERSDLDRHLEECGSCRDLMAEYGRQDEALNAFPPAAPPSALRRNVLQQTASGSTTQHWPRLPSFPSLAAPLVSALAVVMVAAAVLGHLNRLPGARGTAPGASPVPSAAYSVSSVSHGLRITLSLPCCSWPRNALVRASVTVRNLTARDVLISQRGTALGVQPVDARRRPAGEPFGRLGHIMSGSGPYLPPLPLHPGKSLRAVFYGVLSSSRLQANVQISDRFAVDVRGPVARLTLEAGSPPTYTLVSSPEVYADVKPATPATGPLLYETVDSSCHGPGFSESTGGGIGWLQAPGGRLAPIWPQGPSWHGTCTRNYHWEVLAGWVGQPVVHINYISVIPPHVLATPTALPLTTPTALSATTPTVLSTTRHTVPTPTAPVPWPTVGPSHEQAATQTLTGFGHAVVRNDVGEAWSYVAQGSRGACPSMRVPSTDEMLVLTCVLRPRSFRIVSIGNGSRDGKTLDAVVMFRLSNGRTQPLAFNLAQEKRGWKITSIGLMQG